MAFDLNPFPTFYPGESVRPLISEPAIGRRVAELAERISTDCAGRELLVIGVLKGSWIFLADLVRRLTIPVMVDFIGVSSYGAGDRSSGRVRVVHKPGCPVEGRDLLLVEDILDSGRTMRTLLDELKQRDPASLRLCALLDKPDRREVEVRADYVGFRIPDQFVVGYGLDYAERYRNLPFIGYVEKENPGGDNGAD